MAHGEGVGPKPEDRLTKEQAEKHAVEVSQLAKFSAYLKESPETTSDDYQEASDMIGDTFSSKDLDNMDAVKTSDGTHEMLIPKGSKVSMLKEWIMKENISFIIEHYEKDGYTKDELAEALMQLLIKEMKNGKLSLHEIITDQGELSGALFDECRKMMLEDSRVLDWCQDQYDRNPSFRKEWEEYRMGYDIPSLGGEEADQALDDRWAKIRSQGRFGEGKKK